jgi:two-component system cell cycle sensor histidine kinase/response regulator CckA
LMDGMWKLVQRKQAEEALAAEKERLAVTLSSIGDAVIATDMAGNIQLMNHVAEELTGWTQAEAMGQPALEVCRIFDSRNRKPCTSLIPQILAGEASAGLSTLLISRDGREIPIAESGAPIIDQNQLVRGAVLVFRNITLKKRMEEELLKVEKLRSLGILAGGIAHDFNNILTAILGNISLGILYAGDDGRGNGHLQERLVEAEKATLRARDLVQQLLTFAKGGAPVKQLASLKEIVEESASFTISGSRSRCEFNLPQDLWPVEVDEGQISQVVQNLVINASQAMPEGGVITLGAANVGLDETSGLPLPPGRYLKLTITDQGIGIPVDHLPRIFDPYFSTKQQGSGLGLATVYSIVTNHEGHITVDSQLGSGTSFAIFLPASQQQLGKASPARPALYPGEGRILVMDDEEMVREVVGRMLQQLGYEVKLAADGQEALERFREAQEESQPFAGLILDLTVPGGMGGRETMEKLLTLDPGVVSLVSSGYAEDAIMTNYQDYGFKGFI